MQAKIERVRRGAKVYRSPELSKRGRLAAITRGGEAVVPITGVGRGADSIP